MSGGVPRGAARGVAGLDSGHMALKRRMDYSTDDPSLVARLEEGVPVLDVVAFGREAGFTALELARLIQIPPRTYARRVAGRKPLGLAEGERAVRIMRLYDRARRTFRHARTHPGLAEPPSARAGREDAP